MYFSYCTQKTRPDSEGEKKMVVLGKEDQNYKR